jgi:GDPmannose 4,6-dehydratase
MAKIKKKVALISGITGQDGSYLTEFLLEKGYEVHGIRRRSSSFNTGRLEHLLKSGDLKIENLHFGDVADFASIVSIIKQVRPDEIYHLAAQSHVGVSFENPEYTGNIDGLGTLRILEAIRILGFDQNTRLYQASTSELYGQNTITPQNEESIFKPCSPYSIAKLYAYNLTNLYREAYGLFATNGILFNHESPRRGETFVSRKITMATARIAHGSREIIHLGNLNSVRDWGHARDFVQGMWKIINHSSPQNFVLATGLGNSVKDFVNLAFQVIGTTLDWEGSDLNEVARDAKTGRLLVKVDQAYFRPLDVPTLIGDFSKARDVLNWTPDISFQNLVEEMVREDIHRLRSS